jgi:hypothetical protein
MNRAHTVAIAVIALITLALTVDHLAVRRKQEQIFDLENRLKLAESEAIDALEQTKERVANELATSTRDRIKFDADAALNEKLARYRAELQQIQEEIDSERSRLSELVETRQRAEAGLPTIASFQTSKGTLSFEKDDFGFQYVPSTRKLARLRIGKENSTIDPEIIKAWLSDAESAKNKLGYRLISDNTVNKNDGQAKEKHYTKGDVYFKTFFQYESVRGMNDRDSLQYDFFVEVGSESRSETASLESYNKKLGS